MPAQHMQSPFPRVLAPLPDVDHDYSFAFNGTYCRDTACTVTLFSRGVGDYLAATLHNEAAALAAHGRALAVVGEVAWVTDRALLDVLGGAAAAGVCLVLQAEPWLRADTFAQLPARTRRGWMANPPLSSPHNDTAAATWTAGTINTGGAVAWPRMHRKTLVLCHADAAAPAAVTPYATWTGSYNLTDNARVSIEDAVLVHSEPIAAFAYREFICVLAHAAPLLPPPDP